MPCRLGTLLSCGVSRACRRDSRRRAFGVARFAAMSGVSMSRADVVMGIVKKLEDYGVPNEQILGVRYGFKGFYDGEKPKPIIMSPEKGDCVWTSDHYEPGER